VVKPILRASIAAAVVAALAPATAPATSMPAASPRCGTVAFAPQTDDGAFEIVAHSTNCAVARSVARASRPSRFRHGNPRYATNGFSCTGRGEQLGGTGKLVVSFRCARGRSYVSFLRG
jgi:hypothetical protein